MGNSDKQVASLRHEKPSASAIRRANLSEGLIGVCLSLLDDVDLARAAYRGDAMALAVVKEIIGIAGDVDPRDHVARFRVTHNQLWCRAASDKSAVIGFIECHRKISK